MRGFAIVGFLLGTVLSTVVAGAASFQEAQPVWLTGRDAEMNVQAAFRALVHNSGARRVVLRITASSIYRAHLNGNFIGHGPARAAHSFFRVDEWELTPGLLPGANVVSIEVAGYDSNSYYLLRQPSFLQAEVVADGKVVASTADEHSKGFAGRAMAERIQKVQRTSFQRPFTEAYRLQPYHNAWQKDPTADFALDSVTSVAQKKLLPRGVTYPRFNRVQPVTLVSTGELRENAAHRDAYQDRSLTATGPKLAGFPQQELEVTISRDIAGNASGTSTPVNKVYDPKEPVALDSMKFAILDLGANLTGFPGAHIEAKTSATIIVAFDEMIRNGDVEPLRLGMVAGIRYELAAGSYEVEAIEPHTMRYMKIYALKGDCEITDIGLREYAADDVWEAAFACSEPRLQQIFDAGRQTYRQNSTDIFMDCPSRERAGWLCDSFFTARAAKALTGRAAVERNFLENYALPEKFEHLPEGVLPMCYPADHDDGVYIPNWAMWFVVQLEEYYQRTGDRELVDRLKPRVLALLKFLEKYKNSDGLLEKLESWVFVEWSKANEWVQDVNYPSNMLYAGVLDAAGRLYGMEELKKAAAATRETVRKQSFNGEFFVDHAVRRDGKLEVLKDISEVCQYFAFFFNVATPETDSELWRKLRDEFGANRAETGAHPNVAKANAFIGNVLRMDLLGRYNDTRALPSNLIGYYLKMAERTSTIWENDSEVASLNHGFGGHVVHTLYRDVLGITDLDTVKKTVTLRVPDNELQWCSGRVPTPDGFVEFSWRRDGGSVVQTHAIPSGYNVTLEKQ